MPEDKPVHIPREMYPEVLYPSTLPPTLEEVDQQHPVWDIWRILYGRRWTILAMVVTVLTVELIATWRETPIYRATTTIQIDPENPNILTFKDVYEIQTAADDMLQTQYRVLASRSLARRVIEDLRLYDPNSTAELPKPGVLNSYITNFRAFFFGPETVRQESESNEQDPIRNAVDQYLGKLAVTPVRQARLVTISFEDPDPRRAADIINAHAKHFKEQNLQFKFDATQEASSFLSQQLISLKSNVEIAEEKLQQYSRDNQIMFTQEGQNTATTKLEQLEAEFTEAQADRIQKEASYKPLLQDGDIEAMPQLMSSGLIGSLTSQLADLRRQDAELAVTFSEDYPRRRRIQSQLVAVEKTLSGEKSRVLSTIKAEYAAAVERENLLTQALQRQTELVNRINQEVIQYNILKREVDTNSQIYDGLLTRLKEAQVSAGLKASNIRVVDPAEIPKAPVKPQTSRNMLLALMVGSMLGIGLAFFQEYLDSSIKSPTDVTRYLNVPTLGAIPKLESLARYSGYGYGYHALRPHDGDTAPKQPTPDLIVHHSPASLMAEAYRSLRTSLLLSSADRPPKMVVVTSALPSEGKTVTAVNTAISLTQSGARVAIIDTDMRKPRIGSIFALGDAPGLTNFLTGSSGLKQIIHECEVPNLFIIPCGAIPPNPGELILSSRFKRLLDVMRDYFDYVVLDSAPLANVSDSQILASLSDGVIFVVKGHSTSRFTVRDAITRLTSANGTSANGRLLGVVLNDIDARATSERYSGYSAYSYQSGPPTPQNRI